MRKKDPRIAILVVFVVYAMFMCIMTLFDKEQVCAIAPVQSQVTTKCAVTIKHLPKKVTPAKKPVKKVIKVSKADKLSKNIHEVWKRPKTEADRIAKAIINTCDLMSSKYKLLVTPEEIAGICAQESGFDPHEHNGLMQTTYICRKSIAKDWGVSTASLTRRVNNIETSVKMGTYYYAVYKHKYSKDMALVVYNHGFSNSKRHLVASRSMPTSYLRKVKSYMKYFGGVLND